MCKTTHWKIRKNESFASTEELEKQIISYSNTWNSEFAHPFKFSYTGEGLHEKVILRFVRWLQMETSQLNVKFLEKQFKLITNLTKSYWSMSQIKIWKLLQATLIEKSDYIKNIIGDDQNINDLYLNLNTIIEDEHRVG